MAVPTVRADGAKSAGTTGAVTVSAPASVATGDLEIMVAECATANTISITSAGGGAWTLMAGLPITVAAGEKLYVWYRIRAGGDSDPQVTASADHVCAARLAIQTGTFDATRPIEDIVTSTEATSDTSFSFAPGSSTDGRDRLVFCISSILRDSNVASVPQCTNASLSSLATRINYCTNSGNGGGFGCTTGSRATAGTTGTFACTYGAASPKSMVSFAVPPVSFDRAAAIDASVSVDSAPQRELLRQAAIDIGVGAAASGTFFTVFERAAALDAAASIATSAQFFTVFERQAAFDAAVSLASSATFWTVFERAAAIDAALAIATSGEIESGGAIFERSASFDAAVALAAQATFFSVFERAAALDAALGVATAPQRELQRATALNIGVDVQTVAQFFTIIERTASLDASVALASAPQRELLRQAALSITTALASAPQRELLRSAAVALALDIASAGVREDPGVTTHERSAAIDAALAVAAAGTFWTTFERSAALAVSPAIATGSQRELLRAAALDASVGIASAPQRDLQRSASLDAAIGLEVAGLITAVFERAASLGMEIDIETVIITVLLVLDSKPYTAWQASDAETLWQVGDPDTLWRVGDPHE